jgi:predicted GIY-YIG superfamily endonuclease
MFWLGFAVGMLVASIIWLLKCHQVEAEIHREYEIKEKRRG